MIRVSWFSPPSYVRAALWAAFLAAATFAVYTPAYSAHFVNYDDNAYVYTNTNVAPGLTADGVRWAFTTTDTVNWYPLTWLSFQLDQQLYGRNENSAAGFHITNVILHVLNTLLLFWMLTRATGRLGRSAFVAALFALHPLHVESVAWVSERKDVLSTLFWMLTTAAYVLYAERPHWIRYLPVMVFFALGLMAKSMLVTLPCALLLLDYWPLRRVSWRRLIVEKVPLFALSAASAAITMYAQQRGGEANPPGLMPLRVGNALMAYVAYIGKMFWPANLIPFYPSPYRMDQVYPAGLLAGLLLIGVTVLVLALVRRAPYLTVGWFWYLGTLVPVIGVVQVIGGQGMADRYTYVPLIGLFIALVWGVTEGLARAGVRPWAPAAAGAVVLAGCMIGTKQQVGYWRDSTTLWRHTLEVDPQNYLAYLNIGSDLCAEGKVEESVWYFRKSVECHPDSDSTRLNLDLAHYDLGYALATLGKTDEALAQYAEAVRINPKYFPSQYSFGWALAAQGKYAEALPHLRAASDLAPDYADGQNLLGWVLAKEGKFDEAIPHFEAALRLNPKLAAAQENLAEARGRQGGP